MANATEWVFRLKDADLLQALSHMTVRRADLPMAEVDVGYGSRDASLVTISFRAAVIDDAVSVETTTFCRQSFSVGRYGTVY